MSAPREIVRPQPVPDHPAGALRLAIVTLGLVVLGCSAFWGTIAFSDEMRRAFFPRPALSGAVIFGLFAWGAWTQLITPLRLIRGILTRSRLAVSRSLRLVLAWAGTAAVTLLWFVASNDIGGWFAVQALLLVPASAALYVAVRQAVITDAR